MTFTNPEDYCSNEIIPELTEIMHKPTRLYHTEPVGIGTPFVECLTSYLTRLAADHMLPLSALIKYEISPLLNHTYFDPGKTSFNSYRAVKSMNGRSGIAETWVSILEKLTLRNDLQFTTLLPFKNVIPDKKLLSTDRAWCPFCFEQWREEEKPIHEPLLWKVRDVSICPTHRVRLARYCPYCGGTSSELSSRVIPGQE